MTDAKLITPKPEADMFIGWSAQTPGVDRRFVLGAAGALIVAGAVAGHVLGDAQDGPGEGSWDQGDVRDWPGMVSADPYPLLVTDGLDGTPRTALLMCQTKCGVRQRLAGLSDGPAIVRGSLLRRGRNLAIAVADGPDWVRGGDGAARVSRPAPRSLGRATLRGEILDSKCWFGAMRPGSGKAHKACAALCIRHGIAPSFYARDLEGREHSFVMTDRDGVALSPTEQFLALVADPVEAAGELVALGDLATFRVAPGDIRRI